MTGSSSRAWLIPTLVPAVLLVVAACAGLGPGPGPQTPLGPPSAPPPTNMSSADFVGTWGFASYHNESDRVRTEAAARAQCGQPYVIGRGQAGGVMMHLSDGTQPQELRLKAGPDGKVFVGPEGAARDMRDREVVSFDGRVLVLRWVDPEVHGRYGTMVYVRCGAEGPPGKRKGKTSIKGPAKAPSKEPAKAPAKTKTKAKTPATAVPPPGPPPGPPEPPPPQGPPPVR